jgi:hypothetical protein
LPDKITTKSKKDNSGRVAAVLVFHFSCLSSYFFHGVCGADVNKGRESKKKKNTSNTRGILQGVSFYGTRQCILRLDIYS